MAGQGGHQPWVQVAPKLGAREQQLMEGKLRSSRAEVGSRRSLGMQGSLVGSLLPASRKVKDRGRSEEAEGDGLTCAVEVGRNQLVRTQGEVGSPLGVHSQGVQGAGSRGRNEGEEAVCASD